MNQMYSYVQTLFDSVDLDMTLELMQPEDTEDMLSFIMAQMSAKAGIKKFGEEGKKAIMIELEQLLYHKVMEGRDTNKLTKEQKNAALKYLMFLKEKRCGKIKGCRCADGRKQWLYKTKEETSSPTILIEALFLTSIIDTMEDRYIVTCNIPGAFMQSDIDETIFVKLEGELAEILV